MIALLRTFMVKGLTGKFVIAVTVVLDVSERVKVLFSMVHMAPLYADGRCTRIASFVKQRM